MIVKAHPKQTFAASAKCLLFFMALVIVLFDGFSAYAQPAARFVKKYRTNIPPGPYSVRNLKVIETFDHGYISLNTGYGITNPTVILTKYNEQGHIVFLQQLGYSAYNLKPQAIAENPVDHSIVIVGRFDNATANQFLIKVNQYGGFEWMRSWDGDGAYAVLFTHDALNSNNIVVAGTIISGGINLTEISMFDNFGNYVKSGIYNASPATMNVVDMVELPGTSEYCMAVNYTSAGTVIPAYLRVNYALSAGSMYYMGLSSSIGTNLSLVSMTRSATGTNPLVYIVGESLTSGQYYPFMIQVDLTANVINARTYTSSTFTANDNIRPTGIVRSTANNGELMVCGRYINAPLLKDQPAVFTTDLSINATGNLHIHQTLSPTLDDQQTNGITTTYKPDVMVLSAVADGNDFLTLSKIDQNGGVPCDKEVAWQSIWYGYPYPTTLAGTYGLNHLALDSVAPDTLTFMPPEEIVCGCDPIAPKTTYSRILDKTYQTNNFLRADYDVTNGNMYVATTILDKAGNQNVAINQIADDGSLNDAHNYYITGKEEVFDVKRDPNTKNVYTAGRTRDASGHYNVFVLATTPIGGVMWCHFFPQAYTSANGYIVMTITSATDIVVAASSASGPDHIILLRLHQGSGLPYYYDDFQITAAGNPTELFPYIKGIRATNDNGFVVVGSTGHNMDFFGALVVKYDAGFAGAPVHTYNWNYIYRHKLLTYNLAVPGQRSANYASDVAEEANGNLAVVGYTSDNDQNGLNATYEYGFVLQLTAGGTFVNMRVFRPTAHSSFLRFNGINMAGVDYIISGQVYDQGTTNTNAFMTMIQHLTFNPNWSSTYGANTYNVSWSPFYNLHKFLAAGVSDDNTTPNQPNILSVNMIGAMGTLGVCYNPYSLLVVKEVQDRPAYSENLPMQTPHVILAVTDTDTCVNVIDMCTSSLAPMKEASVFDTKTGKDKALIKCYPNPASSSIHIDIRGVKKSDGFISVTDLGGREMLRTDIKINPGLNANELDISNLPPGMYFVRVADNAGTVYPVNKIQKAGTK